LSAWRDQPQLDVSFIVSSAHVLNLRLDICGETKLAEISPMLALPVHAIPYAVPSAAAQRPRPTAHTLATSVIH